MTAEQQRVINLLAPLAVKYGAMHNVCASMTIAQAILESYWLKSAIGGYAIFGIKGRGLVCTTKEFINGQMITIKDSFRVYNSYEDSFKGYYAFLETNPRYTRFGIFGEWDYKKACQKIQASGYASATNYAKSLLSIIEPFGLAKYDTEALALRRQLYERKVYTVAFLNLSTESEALTIRNWVNAQAGYVGDIFKRGNVWDLKFQNISTLGECKSIQEWVKTTEPKYKADIL